MISLVIVLCLMLVPHLADAQVVTWADGSGGKASTEVKVTSEGPVLTFTVQPGNNTLSLVEVVKAMTSPWFCVQARHVYPDGKVSAWFISDTEGICKLMSQFVPPPVVEPLPIIVMPPPVEPVGPVTNITVTGRGLTFDYKTADCPKGIQMKSGTLINGKRTVTMTCRK